MTMLLHVRWLRIYGHKCKWEENRKKNKPLLGLVRLPNLQGYFQTKIDLNKQSNPYLLVALVPFFFRVDEGFINFFISL